MTRKRSLKVWNGLVCEVVEGKLRQCPASVCAYSQKDAITLLGQLKYPTTLYEFRMMWSDCWGNSMNAIVPERGLWLEYQKNKPERAL